MKDLTKIYIDLSKCTEEQQKHIFSLLPKPEKPDYYEAYNNYKYLQFIPASTFGNDRWLVDKQAFSKTELTYPEFIKLFEGGETIKSDNAETLVNTLHQIEKLKADKAELLEALEKISKVTDEGYIFADTDFEVWESELKQVRDEIESLIQKHRK